MSPLSKPISPSRPNIVVVVSDTLRSSFLGCYGSETVQTPQLDALARQSTRFTRAYPESLPTIPVRRALHTGRRAFPFRNYRPVPWDIVYLPGWQALDNAEDTLAENLAAAGYYTGFVTDTLPYFAPGFNFTRGFWQWEFIRGQQQDRWRSPHAVSEETLARYGDPSELRRQAHQSLAARHAANTAHVRHEEDTSTARTFQWAMDFLEDNRRAQPFYLLVDCFDPHEPWEAPPMYYERYAPPDYDGPLIIHTRYGPADEFGYSAPEIENVVAHYSGLVSLVDTWVGRLIDKLDRLGLGENTAVFLVSDHGTNFTDNPRRVIGKPADAMYPGVMHLPLLVRWPEGVGAGQAVEALVYNTDLTATVYDLAGVESPQGIDGRSWRPLISGQGYWERREYVTCRYHHSLCYIDDTHWILTDIDGQPREVFDLTTDPLCQRDIRGEVEPEIFSRAWARLLTDAGGEWPDYREMRQTDAIGQRGKE